MIAFEPLIHMIDQYRNPSNSVSNNSHHHVEIAQGQAAVLPHQQHGRSRNTGNDIKQLTTGTGESISRTKDTSHSSNEGNRGESRRGSKQ